jgi:hypothetical protein
MLGDSYDSSHLMKSFVPLQEYVNLQILCITHTNNFFNLVKMFLILTCIVGPTTSLAEFREEFSIISAKVFPFGFTSDSSYKKAFFIKSNSNFVPNFLLTCFVIV